MDTSELLKVHHYDKRGRILKSTPYRLKISSEHPPIFEKDGVQYYESGEPVSKVEKLKVAKQDMIQVEAKFNKLKAEIEGAENEQTSTPSDFGGLSKRGQGNRTKSK